MRCDVMLCDERWDALLLLWGNEHFNWLCWLFGLGSSPVGRWDHIEMLMILIMMMTLMQMIIRLPVSVF